MQQYAALVGAVLGGLFTFLLVRAGERHRQRREQRSRWDAERLAAYVEYGTAVKRVVRVASGMARTRGLSHSSEAVPLDRGRTELADAAAARAVTWESVLLLGHPETVRAARAWHQTVWQLEFFARGVLTSEASWVQALSEFERTRDEFYQCARRDLGMAGYLPPALWPPRWFDRLGAEQREQLVAAGIHRVSPAAG
ncbi:hypothetical protein AMIS_60570 [Actinoplanes missouriensis 431]|uniref:Secreted protein n=1 Tax=Actinoplanes missouriensis (strain ATCC 14538 / DSM 43046 / CBS 188.64 / JCM 3121 / NBRC 102363 / NCIMB 12654 / NRRL B-3342 / UNCC 431) TaxID=512565 RepID=I0HE40_ACTM4|nr:hypothetical protein [Actinoplanes missouriensis]BAL91277.1 hypothetical protein AMIS_60570 [Actinoplanes missouriensis 431]